MVGVCWYNKFTRTYVALRKKESYILCFVYFELQTNIIDATEIDFVCFY